MPQHPGRLRQLLALAMYRSNIDVTIKDGFHDITSSVYIVDQADHHEANFAYHGTRKPVLALRMVKRGD